MRKQHIILIQADRTFLQNLAKKGSLRTRTYQRATALLELDRRQTIKAVVQTLGVSYPTILFWREKYLMQGLAAASHDQRRSGRPVVTDGKQRAKVIALACSTSPQGHARWTLRLLADKAVELGYCDQLSHTQDRKTLKKTTSSRTGKRVGVLETGTPDSSPAWNRFSIPTLGLTTSGRPPCVLMNARVFLLGKRGRASK